MSDVNVNSFVANSVTYGGKIYTCNGERTFVDGVGMWMYRTKDGSDCDIIVCKDRSNPDFEHIVTLPGQAPTIPAFQENMDFVDLGLSVDWATCNLGASNPEDPGKFFAWGETEGFTIKEIKDDRRSFDSNSYKYKDDTGTLPSDADAATVARGKGWRMPTVSEIEELLELPMEYKDNYVSFKDSKGNSIVIPVSGYISGNSIDSKEVASIWSSEIAGEDGFAKALFAEKNGSEVRPIERQYGLCIRPVHEKSAEPESVDDVAGPAEPTEPAVEEPKE